MDLKRFSGKFPLTFPESRELIYWQNFELEKKFSVHLLLHHQLSLHIKHLELQDHRAHLDGNINNKQGNRVSR